MTHTRGYKLFTFGNIHGQTTLDGSLELVKDLIKLFEKIKKSYNFLDFLRFFLINMYLSGNLDWSDKSFMFKKMIMVKYGEIPIREFLQEHIIKPSNYNEKPYHTGIVNLNDDNFDIVLELYYIAKCKEFDDDVNFISK